jgi:molecular chaperone GrpE
MDTDATDETRAEGAEAGEAEILREELTNAQQALAETKQQADEFKNRFLRARADLENYRRRATGDLERARESGQDSAVLAVLAVYDDLGRALEVAHQDPSTLLPHLELVKDGLTRNLEALGIQETGAVGEHFNPEVHEAVAAVPTEDVSRADTVAQVHRVGFIKEGRLIRPAQVEVYKG